MTDPVVAENLRKLILEESDALTKQQLYQKVLQTVTYRERRNRCVTCCCALPIFCIRRFCTRWWIKMCVIFWLTLFLVFCIHYVR